MSIQATCDSCGKTYSLNEKYAGKRLPCKECGETFEVQGEDDSDAPPSRPKRPAGAAPRRPAGPSRPGRSAPPARSSKKKGGKKRRKSSGPNWLLIGLGGGGGLLVLGGLIWALMTMLGNTHESLVDDLVDATDDMVSVLETVTDASSAKAAIPKLQKIGDRMVEIVRKGEELQETDPLTKEEEDALEERLKERMKDISKRRDEQFERLSKIPEAMAIIQEGMRDMFKKMSDARRESRDRKRGNTDSGLPF